MVTMGNFCLVFLIVRNPSVEIGEIVGIYVARVVLTNARLVFRVPSPVCYRWQTTAIFGKIFEKVLKWRLNIPQLGGIWEIENNRVHQ